MEFSGSIKKLKLHESQIAHGSEMTDHLSTLPHEILSYILSFLTLRDSARTRLLSATWRHLSVPRSALQFDALNVLGSEKNHCVSYQSKFVRAVDQFLEIWEDRNLSVLKVQFCLGNKQASHIDRWVNSGIRMGIEDLELDFSSPPKLDETYVLSDQLFMSGAAFNMKCLRLKYCSLSFSSGMTSWISHLATLELFYVPLNEDIRCVLSGGLNLTSLSLVYCCKSGLSSINVELPCLKKLLLRDFLREIELNCPNLETFEFNGRVDYFKFSHVPLLTKVSMDLSFHPRGCSLTFDSLARHAPKLEALSLLVMIEVQPLPADNTMSCLKRLDLQTHVPSGFDLFTITHLLNSSPLLETLHLEVIATVDLFNQGMRAVVCPQMALHISVLLQMRRSTRHSPKREYSDYPHLNLKEVRIDGFGNVLNEMELAKYLLKNAVALQRMVIVDECPCSSTRKLSFRLCCCSWWREEIACNLLQIKTTAELVILGVKFNVSNLVANGVYQG